MRLGWLVILATVLVPRAVLPQGIPVGSEFRVNTYTANQQVNPSVATDSSGNFVVIWDSAHQDGSAYGVFGQRYGSSGTALGPEFRVNTYTTDYQFDPSVAADSSGNFVVVWGSGTQDGSSTGVFGQRYDSSGTPLGIEFRVNSYTPGAQSHPSVAADPSGNFVVVWASAYQDGSSYGVFGQRYGSSGTPLGPEFRVNTYTTNQQRQAAVVAESSGDFAVVWESGINQDGSGYGIFGQRFGSSGIPLGSEFRVNSYTTDHQLDASVAADSAGNLVVVWTSQTQSGGLTGVFGQRYGNPGIPLGAEFRVNSSATNVQGAPSVAADLAGNFAVVWALTEDGSSAGVFGQRYASSGIRLGSEFRVNSYTTNSQYDPSVGTDSSGNFVVVWKSLAQDGSSSGVFGQRYSEIVPVEMMRFGVE